MLNESNLHEYQKTTVNHIINTPKCGAFLDMGLGKTVSTLTAVNRLMYEELEIKNCLVIAPKRVAETVWTSEIRKWSHLNHLKTSRVIGTKRQRLHALNEKADIYTVGRDNIAWLCAEYGGSSLPFDMIVIDESSSFKNPKSQRFKALKHVIAGFKRVVILTGTPAPNGLIDIWSQIYLLDQGERLGRYITNFRNRFFTPGMRNGAIIYNYKMRKGSQEKIQDKISDICISMKSEDYLNLPKRINNYIDISFSSEVQKKYDDFEKEQVLELFENINEGEISAVNAAALSNKLLQFASGSVYDDSKNWHAVHDLKLKALEEIIDTAGSKPILIAWSFRHSMYRIMERFKKLNPVLMKTEQHIEDWNNGTIKLMTMHPASGGHGLNLQSGGNIIVWFDQTWSLELYQQFNARLDRQGQEKPVIVHHLVSNKTIDQKVIKALEGKTQTQEGLMQAIKSSIRKYAKTR